MRVQLKKDQTLSANISSLQDEDDDEDIEISYQWLADGEEIAGATDSTLTLTQQEVGKSISVTVSYGDDEDDDGTFTSEATEAVANINDLPVGSVTLSGEVAEGSTLVVDTSDLSDEDGFVANQDFTYQWFADDVLIGRRSK